MGVKESSKKKFRRVVMWSALALVILLIYLSVYGAFIGAERAQRLVNTLPLTVYWLAFVVILIAGLVVFRRLVRAPSLLLIHAGCVLILTGGMWGSDAGHKLQKKLFGIDKIRTGRMAIYEGDSKNFVTLENGQQTKELPFYVKLTDFRIEYYKPEYLYIETRQGQQHWKKPVQINREFPLGDDFGTMTILRKFENFKIAIEGDKRIVYDDPEPGYNPALEVQIRHVDGTVTTQYVFEHFPGHIHQEDKFLLRYQRIISDYISELEVIKNNKVVAKKNIEVNHPLKFGGYHFYQHSYDAEAGQYTVLEVTSDTGLAPVYGGYLMLCIGVFWHLWLRDIFTKQRVLRRFSRS